MEQLFTVKEAAGYLRISEASVYKHIDAGRLKASRVGGVYRIQQSALAKFLRDGTSKAERH
jgi:excisionase family DNA binding protein